VGLIVKGESCVSSWLASFGGKFFPLEGFLIFNPLFRLLFFLPELSAASVSCCFIFLTSGA